MTENRPYNDLSPYRRPLWRGEGDEGSVFRGLTGTLLWQVMEEASFRKDVDAETRFAQEQRALALQDIQRAILGHEVALAGGTNG